MRIEVDFSKHTHSVDKCNKVRIDNLQVGSDRMGHIQFINTENVMTVTGDYGNWVFCRPFIPVPGGKVEDVYWLEKLRMGSTQVLGDYDPVETAKELQELLDDESDEDVREILNTLLNNSEDEVSYTYVAYRNDDTSLLDVPFCKKINPWLLIIFEAFDEICRRLKC